MKRNTSLPWLAAVALGVAALTATPAAATAVNDYPEDALAFAYVAAYRYEGAQPVDLVAKVVDVEGMPVEGANIAVQITNSRSAQARTVLLKEEGNGAYVACDAAYLEGPSDVDLYEFTATKDRMHPAVATVKGLRGNICGDGVPEIRIASIQAAKLDGAGQPLSVIVDLVDDGGNPVAGASVLVRATDLRKHVDLHLADAGGGRYSDCNVGLFDTSGKGQISLMVYATAKGYREATEWTENSVGYLCTTTVQQQTTARRTR